MRSEFSVSLLSITVNSWIFIESLDFNQQTSFETQCHFFDLWEYLHGGSCVSFNMTTANPSEFAFG